MFVKEVYVTRGWMHLKVFNPIITLYLPGFSESCNYYFIQAAAPRFNMKYLKKKMFSLPTDLRTKAVDILISGILEHFRFILAEKITYKIFITDIFEVELLIVRQG